MIKAGLGKISKILIFASIFLIFAMVGSASADSWTEGDFKLASGDEKFGINMTMESANDDVKWTINLDDVPGLTESGAQLVICDNNDSFLVGWNSENMAHYKEYNDGWSGIMDVPDNMNVEKSSDGKQFIITVPKTMLGGTGEKFGWAMNVEADYNGTDSSDQQHFPSGWDRWSVGETCYEDTVPSEPQSQDHDHWAGVPTANPVLLVGVLGIALVLFMRRQQK
ncbi:VPXXXP-CTERM sorting domain-containing protein [Methanohalobium sp.]|uniref:VPXXXP-CTERM sorting domain-containing protein n=1 Tax=Methanohalobium sp. TaxID=2837493 RepID=UPI0025E1BA7C|nr:VPXXXP-CTERM sorting domain-containing protein [Methanohalobium sp.]